MSWLQIDIAATADSAPTLEATLESLGAVSVTMTDAHDQPLYEPGPGETPLWNELTVTGLFDAQTDAGALVMNLAAELLPESLPPFSTHILEDRDWEREWMDNFQPMRFGERLWICPSWQRPPEPEAVNLLLDPGLAFGTGTHPTTALCLEWLDRHPPQGQTLVDYGCGSGILGIAALLLGAKRVIGVDNDPQALTATRDNCNKNDIDETAFPVWLPDDFKTHMRAEEPVDSVLANILAEPLIQLAPDIAALLRPGGSVVLSGILEAQADAVLARYQEYFVTDAPVFQDGWTRITGIRR